jgi:DNA-binding NarL/FixJ family response regulator
VRVWLHLIHVAGTPLRQVTDVQALACRLHRAGPMARPRSWRGQDPGSSPREDPHSDGRAQGRAEARPARLTPRQQQIARAALSALGNKELAAHFGVSVGTLKLHLNAIYRRLGIEGRRDLIIYMQQPRRPPDPDDTR